MTIGVAHPLLRPVLGLRLEDLREESARRKAAFEDAVFAATPKIASAWIGTWGSCYRMAAAGFGVGGTLAWGVRRAEDPKERGFSLSPGAAPLYAVVVLRNAHARPSRVLARTVEEVVVAVSPEEAVRKADALLREDGWMLLEGMPQGDPPGWPSMPTTPEGAR